MDVARTRATSSPPVACPFWSERVQMDYTLDRMRPQGLKAEEVSVPDDSDGSPRPIADRPSGSAEQGKESGNFRTPSSVRAGGARTRDEGVVKDQEEKVNPERSDRVVERAWRRRVPVAERPQPSPVRNVGRGSPGRRSGSKSDGLEEALGTVMMNHLQEQAVQLHEKNEQLEKELQRLREEKEQSRMPVIPQSWERKPSQPEPPTSPSRMITSSTKSHLVWESPETFQCTPNGTRVPCGPPPPSPPPLPAWPVHLQGYELAQEHPKKYRGVMREVGGYDRGNRGRTHWLENEVGRLETREGPRICWINKR